MASERTIDWRRKNVCQLNSITITITHRFIIIDWVHLYHSGHHSSPYGRPIIASHLESVYLDAIDNLIDFAEIYVTFFVIDLIRFGLHIHYQIEGYFFDFNRDSRYKSDCTDPMCVRRKGQRKKKLIPIQIERALARLNQLTQLKTHVLRESWRRIHSKP